MAWRAIRLIWRNAFQESGRDTRFSLFLDNPHIVNTCITDYRDRDRLDTGWLAAAGRS
jgi:hypothetical protein